LTTLDLILEIMALKNFWQQQRQQRQQQVIQRRQAVSVLLQDVQQQRQLQASQLRSDLSLFRETLLHDAALRRQKLQRYCDALQRQTQEFLAIAQADRELMAQQLKYDLAEFRATLDTTVKSLRSDIQADLRSLQDQIHELLSESQRQRLKQHIRLTRNLAIFVEKLRSEVEIFLADSALERQEQAMALTQRLAEARANRKIEVEQLFKGFSEFRSQLQHYRSDLTRSIWGEPAEATPTPETKPVPVKSSAKPVIAVKKPQKASIKVATSSATKPTPVVTSDEDKIYQYVEDMQGARLTEIESALSMNRVQAVEALRSLIQQGKVTQRDRLYLISESVK
jgi:predicted house-cleaning noncanonical NTP pyrophosphatase (MazG superfamily)